MYELTQAAGNSYYLDCPAKIGLVRLSEQDVCLIDSGSDKDAGRKVRQLLDRQGWRLAAIYNTHSHADHIGGNAYLQAQTGCPIYAPGIDRCFTEYPILEPAFLYGGCPPQGLRHCPPVSCPASPRDPRRRENTAFLSVHCSMVFTYSRVRGVWDEP